MAAAMRAFPDHPMVQLSTLLCIIPLCLGMGHGMLGIYVLVVLLFGCYHCVRVGHGPCDGAPMHAVDKSKNTQSFHLRKCGDAGAPYQHVDARCAGCHAKPPQRARHPSKGPGCPGCNGTGLLMGLCGMVGLCGNLHVPYIQIHHLQRPITIHTYIHTYMHTYIHAIGCNKVTSKIKSSST